MAVASERITFRVNPELKNEASKLFEELGLDLSTALNMFLSQSVREQQLPFRSRLDVPNRETVEALREAEDIKSGKISAKRYMSFKDGLKDLGYDL